MSKEPQAPSKLSNVMAKIMITCLAALCLLIFSKIGINKVWFEKINHYWDQFKTQSTSDASLEQIREERWGASYTLTKQVKLYFAHRGIKNPVVLFEPNSYLEKTFGLKMPEPVVFYFFSGLKSVWMNSKDVNQATHFVHFQKDQMQVDTIASKEYLQKIISSYKAYPSTL